MTLDAAVIGSGPNGLLAAVRIAMTGRSVTVYEANTRIGGGARSAELTLPGFVHDVCSAIHPLGASSPAFAALPLERHGLRWLHPEVVLAHPLDGREAGAVWRDIDRTVAPQLPSRRARPIAAAPTIPESSPSAATTNFNSGLGCRIHGWASPAMRSARS